jgi:hypothetical protein
MSLTSRSTGRTALDEAAADAKTGLLGEMHAYIRQNRKWWITPIVLALLAMAALIALGGTAAAPFIYTLF